MTEMPPVPDPDPNRPPEGYAAYPRGPQVVPYGTISQLKALSEAYFGFNVVFIVNVLGALGARAIQMTARTDEAILGLALFSLLGLGLLVGLVAYKPASKLAIGKNWSPGAAVLICVLLGMQAWLCCGAIGIITVQLIASSEIKNYGIAGGAFGLKKSYVDERIRQLEASRPPEPDSN